MGGELRTTLQLFRSIARRSGAPAQPAPHLVALGILTAVVDAIAVGLVVAMLFALLAQPAGEGLIGRIVGLARGVGGESWVALALLLLVLVAAKAGLSQLYAALSIRFKNDVNARVLRAAHARLVDMPYGAVRAQGQGDLINTAATDSWQAANAAYLLTRIAVNVSMIVVFAAVIVALSWELALLALLGGGLITLIGNVIARAARRRSAKVRAGVEAIYVRLLAAVQGARLVRAFALESAEKQRVARETAQLRSALVQAEEIQAAAGPLNELGYVALLIGLVAAASALGAPHAAAFTAVALLYRMAPHIRELEANRIKFASLDASLRAVAALLAEGESGPPRRGVTQFAGPIRFEHVSFTPPGANAAAVSNVSFEIPAGRITALIGPSGAGKTTILNLLLRLHEPDEGRMLVGDEDVARIDRTAWLHATALAGQDMDVIEGTVAENIRMGDPEASDCDVREAARDAGALDFIEALPQGFETWIGTLGCNLSGGQRQRISIARALLRRPALLLLDETTSAVESALEKEILDNIMRRCPGATILLVAHRLNNAVAVDKIVRLESGRVTLEHMLEITEKTAAEV